MTLQEAKNYIDCSLSDYFRLGNYVYSSVSINLYLLSMSNQKWNNGTIFECDEDGNEI